MAGRATFGIRLARGSAQGAGMVAVQPLMDQVIGRLAPTPSGQSVTLVVGRYTASAWMIGGRLGVVASRNGRIALITVGVTAMILGGVWAGQGMNLIPGSFMTGSRMWLSIGLIIAIVGIILIALGLRRPGRGRTSR